MRLYGLLPLLRDTACYQQLLAELNSHRSSCDVPLMEAALPFITACLQQDTGVTVCLIVAEPERSAALREELEHWVPPTVEVALLPEPDFPFTNAEGPVNEAMLARARLAGNLAARQLPRRGLVLVTSVLATIGAMRSPIDVAAATVDLRRGAIVKPGELLLQLERLGYERVDFVSRPGQMSGRGGIIDLFAPSRDAPVRIEFLGDEVESLRLFNPVSQLSTAPVERAFITTTLSSGSSACIVDYLPRNTIVLLEDPVRLQLRSLRLHAELAEYSESTPISAERPQPDAGAYLQWSVVESKMAGMRQVRLQSTDNRSQAEDGRLFHPVKSYVHRFDSLVSDIPEALSRGERLTFISLQASRFQELLEEHDMHIPISNDIVAPPPPGSLTLVDGSINHGWSIPGHLTVLTDVEVFGFVKQWRPSIRPQEHPATQALPFSPGDLVAHIDHGIGRFIGLTTLTSAGTQHEYLEIHYLGGDTLYVPMEQIRRLTRYIGGGEHGPSLSRLGSGEWEAAKVRARQSTQTLARELIELYARRQLTTGHAFSRDSSWQHEMEAAFSLCGDS